jgi:hypothetical protein
MPMYRFEFVGEPDVNPVYVDLPDVDAAREEAGRALAETVLDKAIERRDPTVLATKIYDESGYLVGTVRFGDLAGGQDDTDGPEPGVIRAG